MPEELTTEYNIQNWLEATKGWKFVTFTIDESEEVPATVQIYGTLIPKESL